MEGDKVLKVTVEDLRDGMKEEILTDYVFLLTHNSNGDRDDDQDGETSVNMHARELCATYNTVRLAASRALKQASEKTKLKILSDLIKLHEDD